MYSIIDRLFTKVQRSTPTNVHRCIPNNSLPRFIKSFDEWALRPLVLSLPQTRPDKTGSVELCKNSLERRGRFLFLTWSNATYLKADSMLSTQQLDSGICGWIFTLFSPDARVPERLRQYLFSLETGRHCLYHIYTPIYTHIYLWNWSLDAHSLIFNCIIDLNTLGIHPNCRRRVERVSLSRAQCLEIAWHHAGVGCR